MQRDLRFGGEQAHEDLVAPHLQGEDDAGEAVADTGRPREIQSCRGLAQGRPGREDHQLPGVQAVGERVQIGEAGGHAHHLAATVGDRLDLGEGAVHEIAQREVVLRRAPLGDLVDLGLRPVDDVIDVALPGVAHLHDARASLDQAAQDRALLDDRGVVAGVGRGGHERDEGVEVGRPADPADLARAGELGGDRHGIRGVALAVDADDRVVDGRVGRAVEVSLA